MAKEQDTAASSFGWFQTGIYKRSQGRYARQATFYALAILIAVGAWRMYETFTVFRENPQGWIIPTVIGVVGAWVSFRLVNAPRFADFLISVEAEMYKVSWPSRTELIRSSIVVIVTMFGLAAVLVAYDYIWKILLGWLGVTGVLGAG